MAWSWGATSDMPMNLPMRRQSFCLGSHLSAWYCLLTVAFGSALLSGCGGPDSDRVEIEGTVTLNKTPLEKGRVAFRPQPGTASPSAGAKITGGEFSVAPEGGLLPGKFRVEITASRPTGEKFRTRFSEQMVARQEQYIPDKYNTKTQLEITIPPDVWKVTENFELTD